MSTRLIVTGSVLVHMVVIRRWYYRRCGDRLQCRTSFVIFVLIARFVSVVIILIIRRWRSWLRIALHLHLLMLMLVLQRDLTHDEMAWRQLVLCRVSGERLTSLHLCKELLRLQR